MTELDGIDATAYVLMSRGMPERQAFEYAYLIGDTPEMDADGKIVIVKNGVVIDRVDPIAGLSAPA
jgi:hypothetical protein